MNRKNFHKIIITLITLGLIFFNHLTSAIALSIFPQSGVTIEKAVLDELNLNGTATYWIEFENVIDLSPAFFMDWSERGWFVYETLQAQAEKSQAAAKAYLDTTGLEYQSFWIANRILVNQSDRTVMASLQQLPNVVSLSAQKRYILHEPDTSAEVPDIGLNAVEPNIAHVMAPEAWALGYDGTGLVVANIDTGVRYTHDALKNAYRGNDGTDNYSHDYNWFDPYGTYSSPADGNGHGTHTMGTMVGDDDSSNQIGIAPGAEWIACRGCSGTTCGAAELLACAQFIAAPTDLSGANANPDMRPNVVNNSWGDCGQTYDPWFEEVIDGWHAAGVYPVFSNGNASNCNYPTPPGLNTVGNPARSGNVTGVGSSGTSNGLYATHSNWGPTDNYDMVNPIDGYAMLKPQVIAPGVNIRSAHQYSDSSYLTMSGTSMSAPHVSGLVALIMQAAPCLLGNYAAVENLIESTATEIIYDDGSELTLTNYPNFATGWGEINALEAVTLAKTFCDNYGLLSGKVTEDGEIPVKGALVQADDGSGNLSLTYSKTDGSYQLSLPVGNYTVTVSKMCHETAIVENLSIVNEKITTQDFVIKPLYCLILFPIYK